MRVCVSHTVRGFAGKRLMFPGNDDNAVERHEFTRIITTIQ